MTLQETIAKDTKEAARGQDANRLGALRMLQAAIHNREIEKRSASLKRGEVGGKSSGKAQDEGDTAPLSDDEVCNVVRREVKKRKEAITLYEQGNRHDLAERESKELAALEQYLPPELSADALRDLVRPIVERAKGEGVQEFGKVMRLVMAEAKGKADAGAVAALVKELLA